MQAIRDRQRAEEGARRAAAMQQVEQLLAATQAQEAVDQPSPQS